MRNTLIVVATAALLAAGTAKAQATWPGWGPEYDVPADVADAAKAGDALAARQWPDAPFRLIHWLRQSMSRPGAIPDMDTSKPQMGAGHLRPLLGSPQARECYWNIALTGTFYSLAGIVPTQALAAQFTQLAAMVKARRPDHCNGPSGTLATQAWDEELIRYHDLFSGSGYQRADIEAVAAVFRALGPGWEHRLTEAAVARAYDQALAAQGLLWGLGAVPVAAPAAGAIRVLIPVHQ